MITQEFHIISEDELFQEATDIYLDAEHLIEGASVPAIIMGLTELLIAVVEQQPASIRMSSRLEIIRVLLEDPQENSVVAS